jgi:hypothetical protein
MALDRELGISYGGAATARMPVPRALARVLQPTAAGLALAGLVACGVLICLEAAAGRSGLIPASWHGLPSWMSGPLPGVGPGLTSDSFTPLFLAMCGCYLALIVLARQLPAPLTVGAIVALHAAFLLAPPLLSADVFGYIDWGRMGALHGLDPYRHGSLALQHDPVFAYMRWRTNLSSPYGPLFTLVSYAIAPLSLAASLWAFKAIAALSSLACVGLVWACARRLRIDPLPAVVLVGLNPLLLVWAIAGAHNDLLVLAVVMSGVYLVLRGRDRLAGATAPLAAAFKVSMGVIAPFVMLGARRRGAALAGAAAALAAVAVASVAAFGGDAAGFVRTTKEQQDLVATASLPNQIGRWLGLGGLTPGLRALAIAVLAAALIVLVVRTWRGADWIASAGWATLALLATSAWLMPWYAVWALPFAALGRSRRLTLATVAFCAYVVAMRTPF